ncbi:MULTISPECIES: DUF995 domain-containing protein [Rhizobium]|jgi:hypothetical protein|uniref:DUF995 domain-containing protein n=1 Tax=Rhizobium lusitanum TaxID=293958 RepID=A0A1C3V0Y9_9HYPH|nr:MULTISPECIES: DUF995 domain-containing protein [Rhizobium]NRP87805.1 hypothetical protein [Ensifer adhaerens]NKJ04753.1 hypothetical protein [Rhizobium sp. SG741]NKJ37843.1 hypothetical protein [Rhizobium sp. SG570]NTJ10345.1 DUF995 domain-containing protein [Rhizobium lusitanum]SCB21328.1 Protein of unknown function [Rhizobium lusitanum]
MFSFRFVILNAAISMLLLTGPANAATQHQIDRLTARAASQADPMSAAALKRLYSGRSWIWKDGAGFFSRNHNHFTAWSHKGSQKSYAKGTWYVTDRGKLCMSALWYSGKTAARNVSCFLHREKAGIIYQKRASGGKWYVFRHNPIKHDDEVLKLRRGDNVRKHLPG